MWVSHLCDGEPLRGPAAAEAQRPSGPGWPAAASGPRHALTLPGCVPREAYQTLHLTPPFSCLAGAACVRFFPG